MAFSLFEDKQKKPKPAQIDEALGRSAMHWKGLIAHAEEAFAPLTQEWGFAGAKWGWSLRLKKKKRTIVYLTPRAKHFVAGFALGEKAVRAAHDEGLPGWVLETIEAAPKYAEGRGVRLEVRVKKDLEGVKQVAAVKRAN